MQHCMDFCKTFIPLSDRLCTLHLSLKCESKQVTRIAVKYILALKMHFTWTFKG